MTLNDHGTTTVEVKRGNEYTTLYDGTIDRCTIRVDDTANKNTLIGSKSSHKRSQDGAR